MSRTLEQNLAIELARHRQAAERVVGDDRVDKGKVVHLSHQWHSISALNDKLNALRARVNTYKFTWTNKYTFILVLIFMFHGSLVALT